MKDGGNRLERTLAVGECGLGLYLAAGVWTLVHEASFEAVTGRKLERWLVKTVGVLVAASGATV